MANKTNRSRHQYLRGKAPEIRSVDRPPQAPETVQPRPIMPRRLIDLKADKRSLNNLNVADKEAVFERARIPLGKAEMVGHGALTRDKWFGESTLIADDHGWPTPS